MNHFFSRSPCAEHTIYTLLPYTDKRRGSKFLFGKVFVFYVYHHGSRGFRPDRRQLLDSDHQRLRRLLQCARSGIQHRLCCLFRGGRQGLARHVRQKGLNDFVVRPSGLEGKKRSRKGPPMAVLSCYFIKKLQLASPFRGEVARRRRVGGGQVIILGIFKKKTDPNGSVL